MKMVNSGENQLIFNNTIDWQCKQRTENKDASLDKRCIFQQSSS